MSADSSGDGVSQQRYSHAWHRRLGAVERDWDRVVFDQLKVTLADAAASITFDETILEPLQIPPLWENERGPQFANLVVVGGDVTSNPIHTGFVAQTRAQGTPTFAPGPTRASAPNGPPGVWKQ